MLSGYSRPLVFSFDQTEAYGKDQTLRRMFGQVIARLVNEMFGQWTIITANLSIWNEQLLPGVENADRHRIEEHLELKGLNRKEAEELIGKRIEHFKANREAVARVTDTAWLNSEFPGDGSLLSAREFIQHCRQRWDASQLEAAKPPEEICASQYAVIVAQKLADPGHLCYDADLFRWLARDALGRSNGMESGPVDGVRSYPEWHWRIAGEAVVRFAFQHSHAQHTMTWRAIADVAIERAKIDGTPVSKLVVFRDPDQARFAIPQDGWIANGPVIRSARERTLHLIDLTDKELAQFQAARTLYLDALGGNVSGITGEDALRFVAAELAPWRDRLLSPPPYAQSGEVQPPPPANDPELVKKLTKLLSVEKFLSLSDTAKRLGPEVTERAVLFACGEVHSIQKYPLPNQTTMLLWHG